MIKQKKSYSQPTLSVERFVANAYIATCWEIACDYTEANKWETAHVTGEEHTASNCGTASSQVVREDGMWEVSKSTTGDLKQNLGLKCTVYTDSTYSSKLSLGSISTGKRIWWTTDMTDNDGTVTRSWHHVGTVGAVNSEKPNMS